MPAENAVKIEVEPVVLTQIVGRGDRTGIRQNPDVVESAYRTIGGMRVWDAGDRISIHVAAEDGNDVDLWIPKNVAADIVVTSRQKLGEMLGAGRSRQGDVSDGK